MIWRPSRSGRSAFSSSSAASSSIRCSRSSYANRSRVALADVPGRAVGAGQDVQPFELVPGVADVAPDRGVGPLAVGVAVEPQMQLDQLAHRGDHVGAEPQRGQPLAGQLGADHVVVVERHLAARLEPPGGRLADVVQQGGQPDHQVGPLRQPVLQVDGLLEHGEAVGVHVLVPMVLVGLQLQRRQLRQHLVGQPGTNQQVQPGRGAGRSAAAGSARRGSVPPRRSRIRAAIADMACSTRGRGGEAELGGEPGRPQHPQRVVGEGLLGRRRRVQHPAASASRPPYGSTKLSPSTSTAIAFTVKSRRTRSPSSVSPNTTVGLRLWSA